MSEFFPIASELDSFKSWTVEQKAGLAGNIDLNCTSCRDGFSCCLFESRSPTMLRLRCKDLLDVQRLRNNTKGDTTGMRDEICKKCANTLAIGTKVA